MQPSFFFFFSFFRVLFLCFLFFFCFSVLVYSMYAGRLYAFLLLFLLLPIKKRVMSYLIMGIDEGFLAL